MGRSGLAAARVGGGAGAVAVGAGGGPNFRNTTPGGTRTLGYSDGRVTIEPARQQANGGASRRLVTGRESDYKPLTTAGRDELTRQVNSRLPAGHTVGQVNTSAISEMSVRVDVAPGTSTAGPEAIYRAVRNGSRAAAAAAGNR